MPAVAGKRHPRKKPPVVPIDINYLNAAFDWEDQDGNADVLRWLHLYHLLSPLLLAGVPGDVIECGTYRGQTAAFLQAILNAHGQTNRTLHVYDSFQGLPDHTAKDSGTDYRICGPGAIAASKKFIISRFHKHNLRLPVIHEGWFSDTIPRELPRRIAFAYLDGDLYESIYTCLEGVYPRLAPGAAVLVDDYLFAKIPGCRLACDEFLADKAEQMIPLPHHVQAYFRKL